MGDAAGAGRLRLMAVHAHPDDESSKGAGTYARYAAEGVRVVVVSCTGGESGDILNPEVEAVPRAHWDLPGLRRQEMAEAAAILGIEHRWLGYRDSGLPADGERPDPLGFAAVDLEIPVFPLVRLVRAERPQVLVTYDERGGYPHPDHIGAHRVSVRAIEAAADPGYHPEAGAPWQVAKLYYERIFNHERAEAVYAAGLRTDPARVRQLADWIGSRERPSWAATTHVPVADFLDIRDAALRAHRSQVGAEHEPYFFWPNDVQRAAWPYEDFELVRSTVPVPEDECDLFAGLRSDTGQGRLAE